MSERNYKKKYEFQKELISRQAEEIEILKNEIQELKLKCEEKDKLINSVEPMRRELKNNIDEIKKQKEEYKKIIKEVRKMKEIVNQEVYRGRWKIVRWLIK